MNRPKINQLMRKYYNVKNSEEMFQYFELELHVPEEKLQRDVNMEPEGAGNEIRIF